jgi:hypothetical protein
MRNASKAATNTSFAAPNGVPATTPKPSAAAIRARTKKAIAQVVTIFSWHGAVAVAETPDSQSCSKPQSAIEVRLPALAENTEEAGNDGDLGKLNSHRNSTKENRNAHGSPYQGGGTSRERCEGP